MGGWIKEYAGDTKMTKHYLCPQGPSREMRKVVV